ncbi:hypothetical protein ES703_71637 [subsurface metagenome]
MEGNIGLEPHCSPCFNFVRGTVEQKKTVWLAPTVIKREGDKLIIVWRCNWDRLCEAPCNYSRTHRFEGDNR